MSFIAKYKNNYKIFQLGTRIQCTVHTLVSGARLYIFIILHDCRLHNVMFKLMDTVFCPLFHQSKEVKFSFWFLQCIYLIIILSAVLCHVVWRTVSWQELCKATSNTVSGPVCELLVVQYVMWHRSLKEFRAGSRRKIDSRVSNMYSLDECKGFIPFLQA